MRSFMEFIYIDSEDLARQTGLALSLDTDAETWAKFNSFRRYAVDIKKAKFLLDYHNRKGDLADTIPVDAGGFMTITGQAMKPEKTYLKIDRDYWRDVTKERNAKRAA